MASTNNSRFLTVSNRRESLEVGWSVRVRDYKSMTSLVAVIPQYQSLQFSIELNAVGSGSITLDMDDPWMRSLLANGQRASSLRDREYVFEIWEGQSPRFAFLGETVTEGVIAEDETRSVTIAGPGLAGVLNWACVMRPGWPKPAPITGYKWINTDDSGLAKNIKKEKIALYRANSHSDLLPAFNWRFPIKWSTMQMWVCTFKAAQRRGLLKFVKPQFTATLDTDRRKWEWISTVAQIAEADGYQPQEPKQTLLDWLNECTGQDNSVRFGQRLEWMMYPDFKLHVRQQIGVNRSGLPKPGWTRGTPVQFFAGQIVSNERVRTRDKIFNRITAVDVEGNETVVTSKGSVNAWNLREQRNETHKNVTLRELRAKIAQKLLYQQAPERNQWTIKIPYDDPGGRTPFRNFGVGDWIGFAGDPDTHTVTQYRVMAISISMSAESTVPECELTLQTVLDAQMIELERDITTLLNKPKNFSLADLKDIKIPEKPGYKAVLQYDPKTKKWKAVLVPDPNDPASPTVPDTPAVPGTGGGYGSGNRVFIQTADPADTASNNVVAGDFWFKLASN